MPKNKEQFESVELLADHIYQISDGFKKLMKTKLNERAIVLLLHDIIGATNINKKQIKAVLSALPKLSTWYLKK